MNALLKNWKTTLTGLITLVLSVPTFISALTAWGQNQPVNWRNVLVSTTLAVAGAGLVASKDSTTHSTQSEVAVATTVAKTEGIPPATLPPTK
jgi:uncharacterized membrane protein YfcA